MNYANIKKFSIENGTGIRVSLFVSGCTHHCKDCFNRVAWEFSYGCPFTESVEKEIIECLRPDYIAGISVLGGEPMEIENQKRLVVLLRHIKEELPNKTVWIYTGYLYEDLVVGGKVFCDSTDEIMSYCDVLVDGPFISERKKITLKFRGSDNQRIIDVKTTRETGNIVLVIV